MGEITLCTILFTWNITDREQHTQGNSDNQQNINSSDNIWKHRPAFLDYRKSQEVWLKIRIHLLTEYIYKSNFAHFLVQSCNLIIFFWLVFFSTKWSFVTSCLAGRWIVKTPELLTRLTPRLNHDKWLNEIVLTSPWTPFKKPLASSFSILSHNMLLANGI